MKIPDLRIGACSWKYPSWNKIVYSKPGGINYLSEYSKKYNTVEIDQWFWSLFPGSDPVLPQLSVAEEYNNSVPDDFLFTVKAPNSITLTHYYKSKGENELKENPFFLSEDLWSGFIDKLKPIHNKIGAIMLQFEYLNKMKMPSLEVFLQKLSRFFNKIKKGHNIAVEVRNPQYLKESYFKFLNENNAGHVFLQGYFMPDIFTYYNNIKNLLKNFTVIRLHGNDRKDIEKRTNKEYNTRVDCRDSELKKTAAIIKELISRKVNLFVNINNHYEGSAPLTIGLLQNIVNDIVF